MKLRQIITYPATRNLLPWPAYSGCLCCEALDSVALGSVLLVISKLTRMTSLPNVKAVDLLWIVLLEACAMVKTLRLWALTYVHWIHLVKWQYIFKMYFKWIGSEIGSHCFIFISLIPRKVEHLFICSREGGFIKFLFCELPVYIICLPSPWPSPPFLNDFRTYTV